MIQILGLREYTDRKGKVRKAEKFFDKQWRASSVKYLFQNIQETLSQIPQAEHFNLYYTASICKEEKGRVFVTQDIVPIDIDDINVDNVEPYISLVCAELEIKRENTGIVFSGNGLQFIIGLKQPYTNVSVFDEQRHLYKAMCGKLNQAMYMAGLQGNADPSVFSGARLLRLPETLNIKPNKQERKARIINANIEYIDFNLEEKTAVPPVLEGEHIHPKAYLRLSKPDNYAVQESCLFLKHCKENQETIGEPAWYAMLSIIGRLDNGQALCHEYSKEHSDYNSDDVDFKYQQALEASGPRTCDNIETLWDGCKDCNYYKKCKSPIMIKGESHIATADTGFYHMVLDKNGNEKRGKPCYDDLVKQFRKEYPYTTMEIASIVHTFDGKKWEDISRNRIHGFAEEYFDPKPNNSMCVEFETKLKRTEIQTQEWYQVDKMINFQNGILDIATMDFLPHSEHYGFKYVLPYDYEPDAKCPQFEQFLKDITVDRAGLQKVLIQFMGYTLANVDPQLGQKALILYGDGSNGKSVFIEVLKALAGEGNYSTLSMGNEINRLENRYQLNGKLFNVSEETPTGSMVENSVFKAMVSGSEVQARKLYCDAFSMRNYAKIIMACNELPKTFDLTHGMLRRLLIIPFEATFCAKNRDIFILDKLKEELSGIFNLAFTGYTEFMKANDFANVSEVTDAVKNYVEENDSVVSFLEEECVVEKEGEVAFKEMYLSYVFYSEQYRLKPLTSIGFSKRVKNILQTFYNTDCATRINKNGKRVRGFTGIKLIEATTNY